MSVVHEILARLVTVTTTTTNTECRKVIVRGDGGEIKICVAFGDGLRMWAEGDIAVVVDYDNDGIKWYKPREVEVIDTCCEKQGWVDIIVMGKEGEVMVGHEVYAIWLSAEGKDGEVAMSIKMRQRYKYLVDDVYKEKREDAIAAGIRALDEYLRAALDELR